MPFTVVQPLEKKQLAIFYSTIVTKPDLQDYGALQEWICNVFTQDPPGLDPAIFSEVFELFARIQTSGTSTEDALKYSYVEKFCAGVFNRLAFEGVWRARARRYKVQPGLQLVQVPTGRRP